MRRLNYGRGEKTRLRPILPRPISTAETEFLPRPVSDTKSPASSDHTPSISGSDVSFERNLRDKRSIAERGLIDVPQVWCSTCVCDFLKNAAI